MGHGGKPWSTRSRETPQSLDERSSIEKESSKSERRRDCGWSEKTEINSVWVGRSHVLREGFLIVEGKSLTVGFVRCSEDEISIFFFGN